MRIVDTDQAGFQVSGWKSLIDKHNLKSWDPRESIFSKYILDTIVKVARNSESVLYMILICNSNKCRLPVCSTNNPPCVYFESAVWSGHVNTGWFKREFSGKNKFAVIISSFITGIFWSFNDIVPGK